MEAWAHRLYEPCGSRHHLSALNGGADLPTPPAYGLEPGCPTPGPATLLRPPFGQTPTWWYGNINPFPITYGFRPRLRGRLTLSRLALLRNPWAFGEQVSHLFSRYSCPHKHFQDLHPSLPSGFAGYWNAPLPILTPEGVTNPAASVSRLSPVTFSARAH